MSAAIATALPVETLRWITFGHVEDDECGAMNQFLAAAHAEDVFGASCLTPATAPTTTNVVLPIRPRLDLRMPRLLASSGSKPLLYVVDQRAVRAVFRGSG